MNEYATTAVMIIGAGVIGCSIAYYLSKTGSWRLFGPSLNGTMLVISASWLRPLNVSGSLLIVTSKLVTENGANSQGISMSSLASRVDSVMGE